MLRLLKVSGRSIRSLNVQNMRDQFYEQLDLIRSQLVEVTKDLRSIVADATEALLGIDQAKAEDVIARESVYADRLEDIEDRALVLLATQQPVASDLRQLMASIRIVADLQRMGHHAVHIAKVARRRMPIAAVPESVVPMIRQMSEIADDMIKHTARLVAKQDVVAAAELEKIDDDMDALHKSLFRVLLAPDANFEIEEAIDLALLGRYYERVADHSVNMARRVIYQVTGEKIALS